MTLRRDLCLLLLPALSGLSAGQGDPAVIARIVEEGKDNSHVWETLEHLSHEIGPRLTGSTGLAFANAWTRDEFRRLGLTGCRMVKWGEVPVRFDRGPCVARMTAPTEREFEFTARAWSAGTEGLVQGRVVRMPTTEEEYVAVRDDLEGAWVLSESSRRRRGRRDETEEEQAAREVREEIAERVGLAEIAGTITGSRNDLVVTGGSWTGVTMDDLPTDVSVQVRRSDYEAMEEALDAGEAVEVEVELAHYFTEGPFPVYNTVAEIRGSTRPEQVIILSAHLDTWDGPGTQGTQDNGTGSSVMLEAARILMAAGVRPERTIRFCLWTGEEQGLYGSRGYVEQLSEEERAGVTACLVDDGGTNYQGGLVCIASMAPMLDEAIAPVVEAFPELDIANSVQDRMPRGGASDHASFNRAGMPGFFWIEKGKGGEEEKNYRFVHHTQHDTTRYAVRDYLIQSATCSAVVAYNLAQAETLLPREQPEEEAGEEGAAAPPEDATFQVQAGGLTGPWKGSFVGEDAPDIPFTLDLQVAKDGRVRGSVRSRMGESQVKEGRWDGGTNTATFTASSDMGLLAVTAILDGDALKGTVKIGEELTFSAARLPTVETPVSGAWKVYLPDFDATVDLGLSVGEDGVLRGWFKSTTSDSPLYKGTWDAKTQTVTFEYDYPHAGRLPVKAKLVDGVLEGTIGEDTGFSGKRAPADG
jgi:carboxypeptidase Q